MGRRKTLTDQLAALPAELSLQELMAIATLAGVMNDVSLMIPKGERYLIVHISNGRVTGREWRRG